MMVESGVGDTGHGNTMLVDPGAHPELLFGGAMRNQTRALMRMMSGGRVGKVEGGRELIYTVNGRS